jgi:hypothetical protein
MITNLLRKASNKRTCEQAVHQFSLFSDIVFALLLHPGTLYNTMTMCHNTWHDLLSFSHLLF